MALCFWGFVPHQLSRSAHRFIMKGNGAGPAEGVVKKERGDED